jgi:hypothetical protein
MSYEKCNYKNISLSNDLMFFIKNLFTIFHSQSFLFLIKSGAGSSSASSKKVRLRRT